MWRPYKHFWWSIKRFVKYLGIYIIVMLVIVLLFTLLNSIFYKNNFWNSLQLSMNSIWGNTSDSTLLTYSEKIVYDIFLILLLGSYVIRKMKPVNPFEFADVIAYDGDKFYIRYWVIRSNHRLMYNVKIRIVFLNKYEPNRGVNKPRSIFEIEQSLNAIRGVRYVTIEGTNAMRLKKYWEENSNDIVQVFIQGQMEDGSTYFKVKQYNNNDVMYNCTFVSIRRTEYLTALDQKAKKETIEEFINYYNFDVLRPLDDNKFGNGIDNIKCSTKDQQKMLKDYQRYKEKYVLTDDKIKNDYPHKHGIIKKLLFSFPNWLITKIV